MARKLLLLAIALSAVLAGLWLAFERTVNDSSGARPAQVAEPKSGDTNAALSGQAAAQSEDDAASRREQADIASGPPSEPPAVVVFGRIVDERHFPVGGAHVVLSLDQNELARAENDEHGGFELALAHRPARDASLLLTASRGANQVGSMRATVRGEVANSEWSHWHQRPEA